jgi:phosphoadenosine phosphosulfate reductase
MLIPSPRHSEADRAAWASQEAADASFARITDWNRRVPRVLQEIDTFGRREGECYAGISWGKDSTVLADLVCRYNDEAGADIPLVWVRVQPMFNPDCRLVRDVFLAAHPEVRYREIEVTCERDSDGDWVGTGRLQKGFELAANEFGGRYLTGVRAQESVARFLRIASGSTTARTCAPLGWWKADEVFAYLYLRRLPVHPVYAMSMGGLLDRAQLRVSSIGGQRGRGHGRAQAQWEQRYYPDLFHVIEGRNA